MNIFEKETTGKKQETIQIGRQHAMKREDNNRSNTTFMRRQHGQDSVVVEKLMKTKDGRGPAVQNTQAVEEHGICKIQMAKRKAPKLISTGSIQKQRLCKNNFLPRKPTLCCNVEAICATPIQ